MDHLIISDLLASPLHKCTDSSPPREGEVSCRWATRKGKCIKGLRLGMKSCDFKVNQMNGGIRRG